MRTTRWMRLLVLLFSTLLFTASALAQSGDDGDFGALVRMQEKERQANERRLQASSAEVTALSVPCPEGRAYLPYQVAGIEYVEQAKGRALVADAPGLGKTIQALGYLNLHPELRPAIVVCPASVKINWFLEARRWLMMPRGTIDVIRDGKFVRASCTARKTVFFGIRWPMKA